MSEHRCEQCGAENAPDAQFCVKCDFYLGWDSGAGSLAGEPLTAATPVERETHTQRIVLPAAPAARPPADPAATTRISLPGRAGLAATVSLLTEQVLLDPATGGSFDLRIRNTSPIVDGYTVEAPHAPEWLEIRCPEIRLLTDEEQVTTVALAVRPQFDLYVQRLRLVLQVCSVEDPAKRTSVQLVVTVPRTGGPVTLRAEPPVVRLRDQLTGRFALRMDNTGSNYPQRYALTGTDPERVVRFVFRPPTVEVPPRRMLSVDIEFTAPALEYGQQASRALTITAASDQGPVETVVNVLQERSQAPADAPVRLRLEPNVIRVKDTTAAEVAVIVDNRRGSKDRRLTFAGRDPEGRVRFAFTQRQLYIRAGEQARMQFGIEAPPPRPGEQLERPFSVLCNDGTDESEATGSFVQSASASAIETAQLRLEPEHLAVQGRRRGRFYVTVDNVRGALPLDVWFSGTDPEGAVQFGFAPARLNVPPGGIARAALTVAAPLPRSGQEVVRAIKVGATDGTGAVEAEGRFTQSKREILPLLRLAFTVFGGLFAVLGSMLPWLQDLPTYDVSQLPQLKTMIALSDETERLVAVSQTVGRAVVLLLAAVLLLGILGARGRATVFAGFTMAVLTIGYIIYAQRELHSGGPSYGALLVVLGAVLGVVGGFCVKR